MMTCCSRRFAIGLAVTVAACGAAQPTVPMAQATDFTKSFYAWYLSPRDGGGAGGSIEVAVKARPDAFDASLLSALRADLAASAANPDEVVGLDFDPVTGSQDPCERYDVQAAERSGLEVRAAVSAVCQGAAAPSTPVKVELLLQTDGHWAIGNFIYADGDLIAMLKQLATDRKSAHGSRR